MNDRRLSYRFFSEGKQIQTLSEKNKEIGRRWRALSNDEKEKYGSIALEESTSSKKGSWTNVSKLLKNLNENVSKLRSFA